MSFRPIGSAALLYSKYSASRCTFSKAAAVDMAYPPALSVARSVRTANERANEALRKTRIRRLLLSCDIGDVPATEPVDARTGARHTQLDQSRAALSMPARYADMDSS